MSEPAADRWRLIERLYHEALGRDTAARETFLRQACRDDGELRREVESLLGYEGAADHFLERPAMAEAARALLPDPRPALTGRRIGGYDVGALLGAGGMGEVYRARDVRLGREVALKVLGPAIAADPGYLRRFDEEARSASVLNHPNIVTVYGVGEEGEIAFIAMELVEGQTLRDRTSSTRLPVGAVLDLAVQLAGALSAAHGRGIVHRDLKPDNIMVTPDGLAKILDFGIAKRDTASDPSHAGDPGDARTGYTEAGAIIGTVGYMSPEQASGKPAGFASDQFSLGAILHELLTGRRAFERSTKMETLAAIINARPEAAARLNADVTPALQHVLDRCLAKDPADRYPHARDLEIELRRIRDHPTHERHAADLPAPRRSSRRRVRPRVLAVAAVATLATIAGLAAWWYWPPRSLGVLVFANPAHDDDAEYLCLGITETLIERLGALPIAVKPLSLVANLRDPTVDARAAGRTLHVQTILSGSVTRRSGGLVITADLVDVASGATLWTHRYDRATADIFAMWNDIATAVVDDGLHMRMTGAERRQLTQSPTNSPEAFDLFLRARPLQMGSTLEDYEGARALLKQSVAKDDRFAEAWVALAGTYWTATLDNFMRPIEAWPEVDVYLGKAQALNASLLDLHAGLAARNFYFSWNASSAEHEWQAVFKARDSNIQPELLLMYAMERWALGHVDESLAIVRRARTLDPLSPIFRLAEAHYLHQMGRHAESAGIYREVIAAHPDEQNLQFDLADVLSDQRLFDEAIVARAKGHALAREDRDDAFRAVLVSAKGESGYRQIERAAIQMIEIPRLKAHMNDGYTSPLDFARAYARLGETTKALQYLAAAWTERSPALLFLNVDRAWDSIRADPGFQSYVRKLKEQTGQ